MEVIADSKNYQKISEQLGYKPFYFTFDDKYMLYQKANKRSTPELFSLDYNTTLEELRSAIWFNIAPEDCSKIKDLILECI